MGQLLCALDNDKKKSNSTSSKTHLHVKQHDYVISLAHLMGQALVPICSSDIANASGDCSHSKSLSFLIVETLYANTHGGIKFD